MKLLFQAIGVSVAGIIVGTLVTCSPTALAVLQNTIRIEVAIGGCDNASAVSEDCDCEGEVHADILAAGLNVAEPELDADVSGTGPTYNLFFNDCPTGCSSCAALSADSEHGTVCGNDSPPPIVQLAGAYGFFLTDNCQ